ncbi:hypothetical protein [Curtobacterium flaccumfaciens]|uniref:hypothetical protein n=1 Tax=Curtobacterium flaccumfaciens TaxID=2035 RepID=UPI001BDE11FE|nr:hypothetical protein [Curtobacterium flaccumfaciens]MBT1630440.1 hypothetical protein [Curtobacterium flaccumfaciens pv. oortii]MCX2843920.1 hypothetical protein [Curtobacterium flaccumfaciens pv. oortii]
MDATARHQWFIDRLRALAPIEPASADAPDIRTVIEHHQRQITLHQVAARLAEQ